MKPIVGIVCSYSGTLSIEHGNDYDSNYIDQKYLRNIKEAGAIPFLIPVRPSLIEDIPEIVERLDGIILTGGVDVHPSFYREEPNNKLGNVDYARDQFEIALTRFCIAHQIPVLGICRGMQILNVAEGGSLYQDIHTQIPDSIQHTQRTYDSVGNHYIKIERESFLNDIYGARGFVNSYHHQAIKELATTFKAIAWSSDGLIEAIVHKDNHRIIAVQWHPELLNEKESHSIFKYFTTLMSR